MHSIRDRARNRCAELIAESPGLAFTDAVWLATREVAAAVLSRDIRPAELFTFIDAVVELAHEWDIEVRKASPPESPIACGAGCGHCCHISVAAAPPEILRLADHIRCHFSRARRVSLQQRLRKAAGMTQSQRFEKRVSCPLLENDRCSIYEARPLNCRGLESMDADSCRRASYGETPAVPIYAAHWLLYNRVLAWLVAGTSDAGRGKEQPDLFRALLIALEQPEAAGLWLSGRPVFSSCAW